jgi:hypothetical protein
MSLKTENSRRVAKSCPVCMGLKVYLRYVRDLSHPEYATAKALRLEVTQVRIRTRSIWLPNVEEYLARTSATSQINQVFNQRQRSNTPT